MATFKINQQKIEYDERLEYLVIGVVGSGHGGDYYEIITLSTFDHFNRLSRKSEHSQFKYDLETNLSYMIHFLNSGDGFRELSTGEKPALERGIDLYTRILSAVEEDHTPKNT